MLEKFFYLKKKTTTAPDTKQREMRQIEIKKKKKSLRYPVPPSRIP